MSKVIKKAKKGNRLAMEQLFEANNNQAFFLASCLNRQRGIPQEATYIAFKNTWLSIKNLKTNSPEDFTHLLYQKVIEVSKEYYLKANPKAFSVPQNHTFLISSDKVTRKTGAEKDYLGTLPVLQRFIFVLHSVAAFTPQQIASSLKTDIKSINQALEAIKVNIEQISRSFGDNYSYDEYIHHLVSSEDDVTCPSKLNERLYTMIDEIAAPLERKQKKAFTIILSSFLALLVLTLGAFYFSNREVEEEDATEDTSTEETSTEETSTEETSTEEVDSSSSVISSPVIDLDENLTYYADIEVADYGTITVRLDQDAAPVTVSNFVNLAQNGFYDGLTFHRIIEGFMMQGGDPTGTGSGGSSNKIVGEFSENGYTNTLSHTRGAISMARSSSYDSASSQFFICQEDSDYLDGQYAVFGYVTSGLEIVDQICSDAEPTDDNGTISSDAQPVITSITIRTE